MCPDIDPDFYALQGKCHEYPAIKEDKFLTYLNHLYNQWREGKSMEKLNGGQNPGGQNPGEIYKLGQNPRAVFQGGGQNPKHFLKMKIKI